MNFIDALNCIVDEGIESARRDYAKPVDKLKLDGSVKGFEECRGRTGNGLLSLLASAEADAQKASRSINFSLQTIDYWYWRCRYLEIEWVCSAVSALLVNEGLIPLVTPTARGFLKAAEIEALRKKFMSAATYLAMLGGNSSEPCLPTGGREFHSISLKPDEKG